MIRRFVLLLYYTIVNRVRFIRSALSSKPRNRRLSYGRHPPRSNGKRREATTGRSPGAPMGTFTPPTVTVSDLSPMFQQS